MKNRRLISFLSLFSLVLVLSIYYVLVPVSNTTLNDNGINANGDSLVSVTDGEDAYFENLELAKVSKFKDDIEELNHIVASSSSTMNQKIEALEMIAHRNKMSKDEAALKQAIKEAGYSNAYVEYEDNMVNILVSKKEATKGDAVTIIKLAYEKLGNSYIPSVSFKA